MPRDITVIKELFKKHNFTLLSQSCIGKSDKLDYICSCGKQDVTTLRRIYSNTPCHDCVMKIRKETPNRKLTLEFVREYYIEQNCELLEPKYINIDTKMKFKCSCGKGNGYCSFFWFEKGNRCLLCIKDRASITSSERYNTNNYAKTNECREQFTKWSLETYGCENPFQNENVKQLSKQTLFEKHGVENSMQVPEILQKSINSGIRLKNYTLPSGKVVKIRGYENLAIKYLLTYFDETDIEFISKNMPEIWYTFEDGRYRRYFPDAYIISQNIIIEVKSDFTYNMQFKKNDAKRKAVEYLGFKFKLLMFNCKHEMLTPFDV